MRSASRRRSTAIWGTSTDDCRLPACVVLCRLTLNLVFQILVAFFMGQWEEYHTGMMRTNNGTPRHGCGGLVAECLVADGTRC